MLPSPLEANFVHREDFELARSAKWELMQLRSRNTTPTADDIMLIARKAGLAEFLQYTSRTAADVVRADAWLAICTLASRSQKMPEQSGKTGMKRSSTHRFFGQERLTSATLGCAPRSSHAAEQAIDL
jgi:hypothetical protein